jgi:hypothetical protein
VGSTARAVYASCKQQPPFSLAVDLLFGLALGISARLSVHGGGPRSATGKEGNCDYVHADTCQHLQTRFRWLLSGISGFAYRISEPLFQLLPWLRNTILISLVCSFPSTSPIVIFAFFISTLRTPIYPTQYKKSCIEQAAQFRHQYITLFLTLHTRPVVMNHSSSEASSGSMDPWERLKPILETFYMSEKRK